MPPTKDQPRQQSDFVKSFWEHRAASRTTITKRPPEKTLSILQESRGKKPTGEKPLDIRKTDVKTPPAQAGPPPPPVG